MLRLFKKFYIGLTIIVHMKDINWKITSFLLIYHVAILIILPIYFIYATVNMSTVVAAIILFCLTELAITAGYHRYFSHKSYKTNKVVEFFLLFFGTMAIQGSALKWSYDHRKHHTYVDQEEDPYSIKKGFWHAHITWLFKKEKRMDLSLVPDLARNKLIKFQHKHYVSLVILTNGLAFLIVGLITKDYLGAFVLAWWARLLLSHHFTWFINSIAHTWGTKPYNKKVSAVDNPIMAILTFGEGYHNYHHSFANDYRNGIKWYHFDPTKWLILLLHTFGLAKNLRKVNKYIIKKKKMLQDKITLLEKLNQVVAVKKENLEIMIHDLSERISTNITEIRKVRAEKKQQKNSINKLKLKVLKKSLRKDFTSWKKLAKMVTSLS